MSGNSEFSRRSFLASIGAATAVAGGVPASAVGATGDASPSGLGDAVATHRQVAGAGAGIEAGEYHFSSFDLPASTGDTRLLARLESFDAPTDGATASSYSGSTGPGWSATVEQVSETEYQWTFEPGNDAAWADIQFADPGTDGWVGYRMDADDDGSHTHVRDAAADGDAVDFRFVWARESGGQYEGERRTHTYTAAEATGQPATGILAVDAAGDSVFVGATPDGQILTGDDAGGEMTLEVAAEQSTPCWLALDDERAGYQALVSADGEEWTELTTSAAIGPTESGEVGLVTTSGTPGQLATATYSDVVTEGLELPGESSAPLWETTTDQFRAEDEGSFSVADTHYEIEGVAKHVDGYYQGYLEGTFAERPAGSDSWIATRVADVEQVRDRSIAGAVVSRDDRAVQLTVGVTAGGKVQVRHKPEPGLKTAVELLAEDTGVETPCWVAIDRSGDSVSAYYSQSGDEWTELVSDFTLAGFDGAARAGLYARAGSDQQSATAQFEETVVSDSFEHRDVGDVDLAGSVEFVSDSS